MHGANRNGQRGEKCFQNSEWSQWYAAKKPKEKANKRMVYGNSMSYMSICILIETEDEEGCLMLTGQLKIFMSTDRQWETSWRRQSVLGAHHKSNVRWTRENYVQSLGSL